MLAVNGFLVVLAVLYYRWVTSPAGRSFSTRSSPTAEVMSADTRDSEPAGAGSARPTTGLTGAQCAEIVDLLTRVLDAEGIDHQARERIRYSVAHGTRAIILRPSVIGGAAPPAPHSVQPSDNCQSECSDPTRHQESCVRTVTTTCTDSNGERRSVVVQHAGSWVKLVCENQNEAEKMFCIQVEAFSD